MKKECPRGTKPGHQPQDRKKYIGITQDTSSCNANWTSSENQKSGASFSVKEKRASGFYFENKGGGGGLSVLDTVITILETAG